MKTPYPYQQPAIALLSSKARAGVFDAPGLGKTLELLEALASRHGKDAVILWVTQTTILQHKTKLEAEDQGFTAQVLTNPKKLAAPFVIINYEKLYSLKFAETLQNLKPVAIVFDESHALKSAKAKRTLAARAYVKYTNPETVYIATATPIGKDERDIVSQWEVLGLDGEAKILKSNLSFSRHPFIKKAWVCNGWKNGKVARNIISARSISRREEDVEGLPSLTTSTLPIPISHSILQKQVVEDVGKGELARLELISLYVNNEKMPEDAMTAVVMQSVLRVSSLLKAKAVAEYVDGLVEEGEPVVVFAHHKAPMKSFMSHIKADARMIDGETKEDSRLQFCESFSAGNVKVLMCSYKVAGVGIDLVAARRVVLLEPHWEPAMVKQAIGRVRRVSQKASSCIADFAVGVGGGGLLRIEEAVIRNHARKKEAAAATGFGGTL